MTPTTGCRGSEGFLLTDTSICPAGLKRCDHSYSRAFSQDLHRLFPFSCKTTSPIRTCLYALQMASGWGASLVDWRGFGAHDAHDTKKILGAGCGFGGRGICVGWSVAAARNFPRNMQRASTIAGD